MQAYFNQGFLKLKIKLLTLAFCIRKFFAYMDLTFVIFKEKLSSIVIVKFCDTSLKCELSDSSNLCS